MFLCRRVKIQLGKQPTVSELDMDKIVLSIQTKNMNSDILVVCF